MQKAIIFDQEEFKNLRRAIINSIIETSKKAWGVKFVSRDRDALEGELEDMAMYGHLMMCIDEVWPQ